MLNAQTIKQNLSNDNIILLLSELGSEWYEIKSDHIEFESICHHSKSHKLWYYPESKSLFCFRDSQKWDIFAFVQKIKNCSFIDAYNFIIDICHIDTDKLQSNSNIDDWQHELQPFIEHKTPQTCKPVWPDQRTGCTCPGLL